MRNENIWQKAAHNFIWDKPYRKLSEASNRAGPQKWFVGGKLNYTKAIFEKNFNLGNASKEAIIFYKSPLQKESYTYASLLNEVNVLADYLRQKGVNQKSRVLILTDSRKEQVFSILALLRLGVQFGVLYSKFPPPLINTLIQKSKATHIVSNKKLAKVTSIGNISLIKIDTVPYKKIVPEILPRSVPSDFLSFLCFSSGTVGKAPKIFLKGTAGYFVGINHVLQDKFYYNLGNCFILSTLDFAFGDYPLMVGLIMPLVRGGKVIFFDSKYRLNDKQTIKILEKDGIEMIVSSPPFFEILQNKNRTADIKNIILGGQKISSSVLDLIKRTFQRAYITNIVGSQEAAGYLVNFSDKNSTLINVLRPLPELQYKIINKEIYIKDTWPGLALPLNDKQAYLSRWHGRFFKTGDLVKKTSLGFEVIGRSDKIVKHRGRQINLEYLENIVESQTFVQKTRCLIIPNKPKPEITVFLTVKNGYKKFSMSKMENVIKKTIEAKFGNYINSCKIVFIKKFPTSASGKIMGKMLLEKYA